MQNLKSKVKIPDFPSFEIVRTLLPILKGKNIYTVRGLQNSIDTSTGTPQAPTDWSDPDTWIQERLHGSDRELADEIWQQSNGTVNPRYMRGPWLLCNRFQLLKREQDDSLLLTTSGEDFLSNPLGKTEFEIDSQEGMFELLLIIRDNAPCQPKDIVPLWSSFLNNHSENKALSVIKDTQRRRLANLRKRNLVQNEENRTYSLTDEGRTYLHKYNEQYATKEVSSTVSSDLTLDLTSTEQVDDVVYDVDSLLSEGCFLDEATLKDILETWTEKQNLILQGPPGTGKTWLAKRLAGVLLRSPPNQETNQLQAVQFHANTSYEDFVEGYRPSKNGLSLQSGPFLRFVESAKEAPDQKFVFVVEEINRGTPAQIFGELLTLLERDKRDESEALLLSYSNKRTYVPNNVFVIGTMNTADRSLAIMDFALRRRFAFETLRPCFNELWLQWCLKQWDDEDEWSRIKGRIEQLNDTIEKDPLLGSQFAIGHSFVTPSSEFSSEEAVVDWFTRVVSREILPLVSEYWFDDTEKQEQAKKVLLGD
ncbi:MAG: AAA family ATPase [Gammaproteobacteria bacterium]|nr:AAA family ATPase [Gammaproteobacteria bacterium]